MQADLIQTWGDDLLVANAARVSMDKNSDWDYDYQETVDVDSRTIYTHPIPKLKEKDAKLIHYLAKNKHFSCFEHQGATLRLKVPLFVRSQIHRHRQFSYNEISRRYVKDNLEFFWPDKWRTAAENVKQGSSDEEALFMRGPLVHVDEHINTPEQEIHDYIDLLVGWYNWAAEQGLAAEQARMILPQNLYTQFYMSGNLRAWAHFLNLRLDPHAQKECRDIAQQCHDLIEPAFPVSLKALMESEC